MHRQRGFTIVELMVVVAIIVILVALLAPALDQVLYRASLAACQSNLHTTANGLNTYGFSNKQRYPYRPGVVVRDGLLNGDWEPHKLYQRFPDQRVYDERPMLRDYFSLDAMLDPLCPKIQLEEASSEPLDIIFRNSHQWAGFGWFGYAGMFKVGDKLGWTDDINYPEPRSFRFDFIASDRDFINTENLVVDSSHPDKEGKLVPMKWQSEDVSGGFGLLADTALQTTYSGWFRTANTYRGPSDLNYAYTDGSVFMYDNVLVMDDERFTRVPHYANIVGVPTVGSWPTQFDNVPIR